LPYDAPAGDHPFAFLEIELRPAHGGDLIASLRRERQEFDQRAERLIDLVAGLPNHLEFGIG